jgi:ABC-type lipoprotein release transport system permease subunit
MRLVPLSYNVRSLWVRRSATLLTILGLGATVAVVAGVQALQQGFETLFTQSGRSDVVIYLRPGASKETDSIIRPEAADTLIKTRPEIAVDGQGRPLASAEVFLAIRRNKVSGGETNVPIRGVQPAAFSLHESLEVVDGRRFEPGADEVIVGRKLSDRIENCRVGDVLTINVTPFRVVGVLDHDGPFVSEIWGDLDRIGAALERPSYSRVIARVRPGTDVAALATELENDKLTPSNVFREDDYLSNQTGMLSGAILVLASFLATVMGVAAVFTAANTMQAALAARTREIGILQSIGFRPLPIFAAFLFEALLLGLCGGVLGCLLVLPLNGVETGTTNWDTFTEIAFAFRITPSVLVSAVVYSLLLGLFGGAIPAWRASRMRPTESLRRA